MSHSSPSDVSSLPSSPEFIPNLIHVPAQFLIQELMVRCSEVENKSEQEKEKMKTILKDLEQWFPSEEHTSRKKLEEIYSKFYIQYLFQDIMGISRQIVGRFEGEDVIFEVYKTKGSCGYYSLPIPYDRNGISRLLRESSDKEPIRKLVANEIYSALLTDHLSKQLIEPFKEFQSFKEYHSKIDNKQAELLSAVLDQIDPERNKIKDRQFEKVIEYLQHIEHPNKSENAQLSSLVNFQNDHNDKLEEFKAFCQRKDVYEAFITHHIESESQLSFGVKGKVTFDRENSLLEAVLQLTDPPIKLYIWEPKSAEEPNKGKIVYEGGKNEGFPTHIFHTPGLETHFELMAKAKAELPLKKQSNPFAGNSPLGKFFKEFRHNQDQIIFASETEAKSAYYWLMKESLDALSSFALPETRATPAQVIHYLNCRTKNLDQVIFPNQLWNYDVESPSQQSFSKTNFPLHSFLTKFCSNTFKKKFIVPILYKKNFHGLVITKTSEGGFQCEYFNPMTDKGQVLIDDNLIILAIMKIPHLIKRLLTQLFAVEQGKDYSTMGKPDFIEAGQILAIKTNYQGSILMTKKDDDSFSIVNSSIRRQIFDFDNGYIVAQTLLEKATNKALSIPTFNFKEPMSSIKAIAQVRAKFSNAEIVGEEAAKNTIYDGFVRRLAMGFLSSNRDIVDSYLKAYEKDSMPHNILVDINPILEKIYAADFINDENLEPQDFIAKLLTIFIQKFPVKDIQQFCELILQAQVNGKDGSVTFLIQFSKSKDNTTQLDPMT